MIILTQELLKGSTNGYISTLACYNFLFEKPTNSKAALRQLTVDASRDLRINGGKIPREYWSEPKLLRYISFQLGEYFTQALLKSYSQKPSYVLKAALDKAIQNHIDASKDLEYVEKYSIVRADSISYYNIYVKNGVLHYDFTFKKIMLPRNRQLAGTAESVAVYDEQTEAFMLEKITCSNEVLKEMLLEGTFDTENTLARAKQLEAPRDIINNILIPELYKARKKVVQQIPFGYSTLNPHWTVILDDKLIEIRTYLEQHRNDDDVLAVLHSQMARLKEAIDQAASRVTFKGAGLQLLNQLAMNVGLKPPFSETHLVDDLYKSIIQPVQRKYPDL